MHWPSITTPGRQRNLRRIAAGISLACSLSESALTVRAFRMVKSIPIDQVAAARNSVNATIRARAVSKRFGDFVARANDYHHRVHAPASGVRFAKESNLVSPNAPPQISHMNYRPTLRRGVRLLYGASALLAVVLTGWGADHRDGPLLVDAGSSLAGLDLNDLYIFQSPTNSANTVLIMTVSLSPEC